MLEMDEDENKKKKSKLKGTKKLGRFKNLK